MKPRFFGYRSFMPEYDAMKRFRAAGVDTVTMMISNGYTASGHPYTAFQPVWINDHQYDFDMVDRQIAGIVEAVPDVKLIFYIDLNTPMWWHRRKHWRCESFNQLGRICADPEWKRDTADYFKALLTHLETNHRDRVAAYIYTGGSTTEWFDLSEGTESETKFVAYRRWCAERGYPDPVDIPPPSVRNSCPYGKEELDSLRRLRAGNENRPRTSLGDVVWSGAFIAKNDGNGLFRTPAANPEAYRYWTFCNELVADTAIFFAKAAREVIRPEIQLGTTFGYTIDVLAPGKTHSDYLRVFDAPELDFFLAPATYYDRGMGGGSGSMIAAESLTVRGKRMLNSCDHRTYTCRNLRSYDKGQVFWSNDAEVRAGMKREFAMNFINGASTWWFDMVGGWWDSAAAMETIRTVKAIWDAHAAEEPGEVFEIAGVCQPGNYALLNEHHPSAMDFFRLTHLALNLCGAPFAFCALSDVEKLDVDRIKLWIFQHPFRFTAEEEELLRRRVLRNGNTVVWLYAPGIVDAEGKWNEANVERIGGIPYGTPDVTVREMGDWRSVLVSDPAALTPEVVFGLVGKAGVHRWCDRERPVFANAEYAAVHTGEAETLRFTFPKRCRKVVELYSKREWCDVESVEVTSEGPDTWLFRYE